MYQYQYEDSKVVLFLSPKQVGQAGNFWTHPCITFHLF